VIGVSQCSGFFHLKTNSRLPIAPITLRKHNKRRSSGNPKLVGAVNNGTGTLTVELDVDVVAVLSGMPGILARLE